MELLICIDNSTSFCALLFKAYRVHNIQADKLLIVIHSRGYFQSGYSFFSSFLNIAKEIGTGFSSSPHPARSRMPRCSEVVLSLEKPTISEESLSMPRIRVPSATLRDDTHLFSTS